MKKLISGCIILCLLFSCHASRKVVKQQITLDTISVSATNNPLDIYRGSEPVIWDITHERVALGFDFKEKTASGKAWITLHPYAYMQDSIVLDAQNMRFFKIEISGRESDTRYTYNDDKVTVTTGSKHKWMPSDTVNLYVEYTAMPYATNAKGSAAISEARGLYFINTDHSIPGKPAQIWTQGETQSNSHWMPVNDRPNERLTVALELTVPDGFKTLSNGALRDSKKNGAMRTDYWAMDKPIQAYAVMFAIGNFDVVKESWKGREVSYYVEPDYKPYAGLMFQHTPEMMEFFSGITGVPYPWNKYSQIVVRDYVSGAMENTSASLFGEFMNQTAREHADNNFEDVVSHELFHQWFGDYVTAESWSNLTVNESFANYSEQLWRKYKYGEQNAAELKLEDLNKYLSATQYNDKELVRFHYRDKEDMFDRISYQKGGAILHYIHGLAGDSAFYRAMNIYLTKNALHSAEAVHWRHAVEEATGQDWNWFFNQWYFRDGHPELKVTYDYSDSARQLTVTVKQTQQASAGLFDLPLKTLVAYGNESSVVDWRLKKRTEKYLYPYKDGRRPVIVPDAQHWLVGTIDENKTPEQWLTQYRITADYISRRKSLTNAFRQQSDSNTASLFHLALKDSIGAIRNYALTLLYRIPDEDVWEGKFKDEIAWLAGQDGNRNVRAAAFDVLGKWKIENQQGEMKLALNDSSYLVAGAALNALRAINKDTALVYAKRFLNKAPRGALKTAVWTSIASAGKAEDLAILEKEILRTYGAQKLQLAGSIYYFAISTKDEAAYNQSLTLLGTLAINESITSYRKGLAGMISGLISYYKKQDKGLSKEINEKRIALARQKMEQVIDAENDEDVKKDLKKMLDQ